MIEKLDENEFMFLEESSEITQEMWNYLTKSKNLVNQNAKLESDKVNEE